MDDKSKVEGAPRRLSMLDAEGAAEMLDGFNTVLGMRFDNERNKSQPDQPQASPPMGRRMVSRALSELKPNVPQQPVAQVDPKLQAYLQEMEQENKAKPVAQETQRTARPRLSAKAVTRSFSARWSRGSKSAARGQQHVVAELVESERVYIQYLRAIVDLYIHPLRRCARERSQSIFSRFFTSLVSPLRVDITEQDIDAMFPEVEALLELHSVHFLPPLTRIANSLNHNAGLPHKLFRMRSEKHKDADSARNEKKPPPNTKMEPWEVEAVAQFFISQSQMLRHYSKFVGGVETALSKIAALSANEDFERLQTEAMKNKKCKGQPIQSLMIMPVQRITRYHLFLSELIRRTNCDAKVQEKLVQAHKLLKCITAQVNECRRRAELKLKLTTEFGLPNADELLNTRTFVSATVFGVVGNDEAHLELHVFDEEPMVVACFKAPGMFVGFDRAVCARVPSEIAVQASGSNLKLSLPLHDEYTPEELELVGPSGFDSDAFAQRLQALGAQGRG